MELHSTEPGHATKTAPQQPLNARSPHIISHTTDRSILGEMRNGWIHTTRPYKTVGRHTLSELRLHGSARYSPAASRKLCMFIHRHARARRRFSRESVACRASPVESLQAMQGLGCEALDYLGVARQLRPLRARLDRRAGAGDLPERGGVAARRATAATWRTRSLTVSSSNCAELTMVRGWVTMSRSSPPSRRSWPGWAGHTASPQGSGKAHQVA